MGGGRKKSEEKKKIYIIFYLKNKMVFNKEDVMSSSISYSNEKMTAVAK